MFWGREDQLQALQLEKKKKIASLVVLSGRRRIGKSSLISEFGKTFKHVFEIVGIAPEKNITNQDQLDNFANQLSIVTGFPGLRFTNWLEAFTALAKACEKKEALIFLDEISWMASKDKKFVGTLKIAWDTLFKKNNRLVVALCGSVSSWIEDNILNDAGFYGRVSWDHKLEELPINLLKKFWGKNQSKISPKEKMQLLAITGGIPKYLEEILPSQTATQNIERLCFTKSGYLFKDFQKIFNDIFNKKAKIYKLIIEALILGKLSPKNLADKLKMDFNGDFSKYIFDLESAGFISREYTWDLCGQESKLSQLRVSDNYIRFYLKYIEPNSNKIHKGIFKFNSLDGLLNWDTISGLQFENVVLNNSHVIFENLGISRKNIIQYGSYFQTKTKRREGCQVDLLVLCKRNCLYVIELKYKKKIGIGVIDEVQEKIRKLNLSKEYSVRTCLVYMGEKSKELIDDDYFDETYDLSNLLS
ncbi:MAG: ATP-binding protein [Bacteriovoracaceae bacterium]|nr:ATP-binding protein [Bacteriovoracaceae bacterium]